MLMSLGKKAFPMNTPINQVRVALALIVAPFVIGVIVHFFGGRSLTVTWNGPLYFPSRLGFELHDLGLVLIPSMFFGLVWLAFLSIRSVRLSAAMGVRTAA